MYRICKDDHGDQLQNIILKVFTGGGKFCGLRSAALFWCRRSELSLCDGTLILSLELHK